MYHTAKTATRTTVSKVTLLACITLGLSGCWNGGNNHVNLGDVSIGQQLIDLKKALELQAITPTEYNDTKAKLLSLGSLCTTTNDDADERDD